MSTMAWGCEEGGEASQRVMLEGEVADPKIWADKFGDYLLRFASYRVRRREIAEELVQDTFLSAWKSWDRFQGRSSLKTWLVTILKNKIIDYYEKSSRENEVCGAESDTDRSCEAAVWDSADVVKHHGSPSSDTPESLFEYHELLSRISRQVELLPAKMKRAFLGRILEDIPADILCKELNISESNLWVMVFRARERVRLCVE